MLGERGYTLTCCVIGGENLNPFITYQWTKNNGTETQIQDGSNPRTISFDPLRVSDAGRYTCQARISSASLSNDFTGSAFHDFTILSEFTFYKVKLILSQYIMHTHASYPDHPMPDFSTLHAKKKLLTYK